MPRKRKSITILRIESMSTGRVHRPPVGVDDFTGEQIEPVEDMTPVRPIADPQVAINTGKRQRAADYRKVLEAVLPQALPERTVQIESKLVAPHTPGQRAIATIAGNAVLYPMPPWRR